MDIYSQITPPGISNFACLLTAFLASHLIFHSFFQSLRGELSLSRAWLLCCLGDRWNCSSLTWHTGSLWLTPPACNHCPHHHILQSFCPPAPVSSTPPLNSQCFHALLPGCLQTQFTPPLQWGLPGAYPTLRKMNLTFLWAPPAICRYADTLTVIECILQLFTPVSICPFLPLPETLTSGPC